MLGSCLERLLGSWLERLLWLLYEEMDWMRARPRMGRLIIQEKGWKPTSDTAVGLRHQLGGQWRKRSQGRPAGFQARRGMAGWAATEAANPDYSGGTVYVTYLSCEWGSTEDAGAPLLKLEWPTSTPSFCQQVLKLSSALHSLIIKPGISLQALEETSFCLNNIT